MMFVDLKDNFGSQESRILYFLNVRYILQAKIITAYLLNR